MSVTVRVAVRVRPISEKEDDNLVNFVPHQPQIIIGHDRHFTFDYVFSPVITQSQVYHSCIEPLFEQYVKGYNATVLAYGQTGSGKTYSMGTSGNHDGIVPRFAKSLFSWLDKNQEQGNFKIRVSFLELYNEDIIDLLGSNGTISIREDSFGNISWTGIKEEVVDSYQGLLNCLYRGSEGRATASTDMNHNSSRSHAIFSVTLVQHIVTHFEEETMTKELTSKFHFVDLAGSERLKKTNAVGDRAREGISINAGLLALGNVISALGDESKRGQFVPYRDSKLTRLLQDSLGGNSQTLMLACVSPAASNQNETLSTLKYANRAKNITNKVIINQTKSDHHKEEIFRLKEQLKTSDAFIKAVHEELDAAKAKNRTLETANRQLRKELSNNNGIINDHPVDGVAKSIIPVIIPPPNSITNLDMHKTDDEITLIGSGEDDTLLLKPNESLQPTLSTTNSTGSLRRKKRSSGRKKSIKGRHKPSVSTDKTTVHKLDYVAMLDKHKTRIKKEALFIKQTKELLDKKGKDDESSLLVRMMLLFQSSLTEQRQLIYCVENNNTNIAPLEKSYSKKYSTMSSITTTTTTTTTKSMKKRIPVLKDTQSEATTRIPKKKSLIPAPPADVSEVKKLRIENQETLRQLKQIGSIVKKAMGMIDTTTLRQMKPLLGKAILIYNAVLQQNQQQLSSVSPSTSDTIPPEKLRIQIHDLIGLDQHNRNINCSKIIQDLNQKRLRLIREQKELIAERKAVLAEEGVHSGDDTVPQYMDERIDTITIQADFLSQQIRYLSQFSKLNHRGIKKREELLALMDKLDHKSMTNLLFDVLQLDMVPLTQINSLQSNMIEYIDQTMVRLQEGVVTMRRSGRFNHNQHDISETLDSVMMKIVKSPIRCLPNGLLLAPLSGKIPKRCS